MLMAAITPPKGRASRFVLLGVAVGTMVVPVIGLGGGQRADAASSNVNPNGILKYGWDPEQRVRQHL